jgi:hypothetical protein
VVAWFGYWAELFWLFVVVGLPVMVGAVALIELVRWRRRNSLQRN